LNLTPLGFDGFARADANLFVPFVEGSFHLFWSVARASKVNKF
jgi:hypothetical protein